MSDVVAHILRVHQRADELRAVADNSRFPKDDIRDGFLYDVSNALYCYSVSLGLAYSCRSQSSMPGQEIAKVTWKDLRHTRFLSFYVARLRAHLFLDTWFSFEDVLRGLYLEVVPEAVRLADTEGERSQYKIAKRKVHIPIPTLWSRVSDEARRASGVSRREARRHQHVVEFWSKTRNTIHSNTKYSGPRMTLKLASGEACLQPDEPTDFMSQEKLPMLIDELVKSFEFLRAGLPIGNAITTWATARPSPYR